ncbi:cdp-diacylglycerol--inositol 3-phosphatidyltransferase [Anaeramoeba ignava]|uniref:CDP-diacylglycerol--inositol 3-phosphatidyltransferase n=1 Tax=Anaeramoeba ignava TaxID=1746090 RepID=A0A9Q0LEQ2_ANAIG|nr:cdp-diacylglycerol--inositol 3-phosphatidyltransferase [Anaeramoeba ignava]|eukprot:Anaeramoba_ignava/a92564_37.p1 GENE.a92564_37~~a92564_37.p1  ORF type:complete len:265 (-),score=79.97 a92564_37:30-824(-)
MKNNKKNQKNKKNDKKEEPVEKRAKQTNYIWFYVPNLIGYLRLILMSISFFSFQKHPVLTVTSYFFSYLLDYADGFTARLFNQCSMFGAVLDMVTDRSTSCGLLMVVGTLYPKYTSFFTLTSALDICSHWMQMYASLVDHKTSHKKIDSNQNILLRIYYGSRLFMGTLIVGTETFGNALYLNRFSNQLIQKYPFLDFSSFVPSFTFYSFKINNIFAFLSAVTFPLFLIKQIVHVVQFFSAASKIIEKDLDAKIKERELKEKKKN